MICANSYRYKNSTTLQSFSMIYWFFHDCPWSVIFHDFPDPENGCTKFHDFPLLSTAGDTVSDWCLKLLNLVLLSTVNTDYSTWRRNSSQHTAVTETPAGSSQLSLRHLLSDWRWHDNHCTSTTKAAPGQKLTSIWPSTSYAIGPKPSFRLLKPNRIQITISDICPSPEKAATSTYRNDASTFNTVLKHQHSTESLR